MAMASPQMPIAELRHWLARMESHSRTSAALLPFGLAEVDAHVPGGGLQLGHLHEVIEGGAASEYAGLATLFAAGVVARLAGPVLWCLRVRDLFAPALARIGLHPDRVIYCETWNDREVLPAMEEGLKCRGLAAVVGEATRLSLTASRRLQLAAGEMLRLPIVDGGVAYSEDLSQVRVGRPEPRRVLLSHTVELTPRSKLGCDKGVRTLARR